MKRIATLVAALLCLALGAPAVAQPNATRLEIAGSTTMAPLVTALAKRFMQLNPGVTVEIRLGGSARGVEETRRGQAHIGMVARALTEAEGDLTGFPIARDAVALLVHADNPVRQIKSAELRDIYAGHITRWEQVGGNPGTITVISRDKGRGALEVFAQHFGFKEGEIKAAKTFGDNALLIDALRDDPRAIAIYSLGDALRLAKRGAPIRLLSIDGRAATPQSVRSGNYPLLRPLTLVTSKLPQGITKKFVDFCLSGEASAIVIASDFVAYLD
jgi:phosphate transport system substrate-binding protein